MPGRDRYLDGLLGEHLAGLLLIKPICFGKEECTDEVIEKSTDVRGPTASAYVRFAPKPDVAFKSAFGPRRMIPDYESGERSSNLFGRAIRHSAGTNVSRRWYRPICEPEQSVASIDFPIVVHSIRPGSRVVFGRCR
jgi:hypothetical protein